MSHSKSSQRQFHRLDIVDASGTSRLTLGVETAGADFDTPEPATRTAPAAGLILRGAQGEERGGIAWIGGDDGSPIIALDHDTGDEAVGAGVVPDGTVRLFLAQRPHADGPGQRSSVVLAIPPTGAPSIDLNDSDGHPRLSLVLTEDGSGAIEFRDRAGQLVQRICPESET